MMLLIVNRGNVDSLRAAIQKELQVEVLTASNMKEAENLIVSKNDLSWMSLSINHVLIYSGQEQDDLIRLNHIFPGAIIARVENEEAGFKLVKQRLVTDFYTAKPDMNLEMLGLKKAFRIAMLKKRINVGISQAYEKMRELETWKMGS